MAVSLESQSRVLALRRRTLSSVAPFRDCLSEIDGVDWLKISCTEIEAVASVLAFSGLSRVPYTAVATSV